MVTTYFSTILRSLREGLRQLLSKLDINAMIEREIQQTQKNCTELNSYARSECPSDILLKLIIFYEAFYNSHVSDVAGSERTPTDVAWAIDTFNRRYRIGMWKKDVDCEYVAKCLRETDLFDSVINDPEILKHYAKKIKIVEAYRKGLFDMYDSCSMRDDRMYLWNSSEPEKGITITF